MQSMQQRALGAAAGVMGTLENRPARSDELPARPLEILSLDPPADDARLAVRRAMWPPVAVQVCAGLTYAVVLASSWFVLLPGFDWQMFLFFIIWHAWPMVITVGLAVAVSWRGFAILVVGYVLVFAGVDAPLFVSTDITIRQALTLWFNINGPGTLLALAFIARPIRAVGLLVLVFMIAAVAGAIVLIISFDAYYQSFNAYQKA